MIQFGNNGGGWDCFVLVLKSSVCLNRGFGENYDMHRLLRGPSIILLFLLTLLLALPYPVRAAGAIDQSYIPSTSTWNWIQPHMPIGQSFTPTTNALVGLDLGLSNVLVQDQSYNPGFGGASWNYVNAHSPIGQSFTPIMPLLGAVDVGIFNEVMLDQSFNPGFSASGVGWNWVQAHQPIGQAFKPTYPQLWYVQLGLENVGPDPAALTLVLRQGTIQGIVVAQQNFTLPVSGPSMVSVVFNPYPGIDVIPGSTYVLDLVGSGSDTVRWYNQIPAGYGGGTAYTDGNVDASLDYFFETYGFGNTITMNIHWSSISGPTLASVTLPIPPMDTPIMMRFNLTAAIAVSPGAKYVIELLQTPQSVRWYIVSPANYSGGSAITDGTPKSNQDYLFDTYGASSSLTVNIRSNAISGPLIGSTTATIPLTGYALIHVDFPGTIPLTPGSLYVIDLQENVKSMQWFIVDLGGSYSGGTAITDGSADPNGDYIFQTYGPPGLTPTTLSINYAPATLNLTAPPGTGTITVTLSPNVAAEPISLYYSSGSTGPWTTITTGHTDPTGRFATAWAPPQPGTYFFRADFAGDVNYAASTTTTAPNAMIVVPEFPLGIVPLMTVLALVMLQLVLIRRSRKK